PLCVLSFVVAFQSLSSLCFTSYYLLIFFFFFLRIPHPPKSTLFPYTTLFRSLCHRKPGKEGSEIQNRRSITRPFYRLSLPRPAGGVGAAPAPPPAVFRPSVSRSAFESASVLCGVTLSGSTRTIR